MKNYQLNEDITFIEDEGKLVVLDFDSGDYYMAEGACVDLLIALQKNSVTDKSLLKILNCKYDPETYDLVSSLDMAISVLLEMNIIKESEIGIGHTTDV